MQKKRINTTAKRDRDPAFEAFVMRAFVVGAPGEDLTGFVISKVHSLIAVGVLKIGDPLPSADTLAVHLRSDRYPVNRAYAALRDDGTVETSRAGTAVIAVTTAFRADVAKILSNGRRIGMSYSGMANAVRAEIQKMKLAKI